MMKVTRNNNLIINKNIMNPNLIKENAILIYEWCMWVIKNQKKEYQTNNKLIIIYIHFELSCTNNNNYKM